MKECLVIRSSISTRLARSALFRGFGIACGGVSILFFGGIFLPVAPLKLTGGVLFLIALGLIALGMIPYRRLSRLQLQPDELLLKNSQEICYCRQGDPLFTISLDAIDRLNYIDRGSIYGIALWFQEGAKGTIQVHRHVKLIDDLQRKAKKMGKGDLFLPYFSKRSFEELIDWRDRGEN